MTGGSYGGQIQFAAAGFEQAAGHRPARRDHPADHLERPVLLPGAGEQRPAAGHRAQRLGDLRRGTGVFKYQWAALFTPSASSNGAAGRRRPARPGRRCRTYVDNNCANFEPRSARPCSRSARSATRARRRSTFLRSNSVASYMRRRPGAHPDRPGPGRHPVQPAGVGGDLHRAQAAGHAGLAGLAVVGPQRLRAASRASWTCGTPTQLAPGPRRRWPGSTTTSADRGTAAAAGLPLLPRLGLRRRPTTSTQAYATAPSYPVGTERTFYLSGTSTPGGRRRAGDQPAARCVAGHEQLHAAPRRSARTTPRRRRSTRAGRSPIRRARRSGSPPPR